MRISDWSSDVCSSDLPAGQGIGIGLFETGRVDEPEIEIEQPSLALAPVARDARQIVDQRQRLARQPVEKRGLADMGAADAPNDRKKGHGFKCRRSGESRGGKGRVSTGRDRGTTVQ